MDNDDQDTRTESIVMEPESETNSPGDRDKEFDENGQLSDYEI